MRKGDSSEDRDKAGGKRGDKTGGKIGEKPGGKPEGKPGGKSGEKSGEKSGTKAETETAAARRPPSPYTVHTLDTAITHLEVAMGADKAMAIFGSHYWHGRVLELRSTPGILDVQERRLRSLLDRLALTGERGVDGLRTLP